MTITISYHHYHNITIITISPLSQSPLSQSSLSLSPLSQPPQQKRFHSKEISQHRKRKSRTKALFSHLPLSLFEGRLAGKLRFHIFNFHSCRDVSHENFVFTSSTFRFWGKSRRKASVSHLPFSLLEGRLARKCRFHIFHFQILRDFSHWSCAFISWSLAREAFLKVRGCTKCCVLQDKACLGKWMGKLLRRAVAEHARLNRDHGRISRAVELLVQASSSQLELSKFERCLARKLRFHIFHFQILREVSQESFGFTSSIFTFGRTSRTKASVSHLPLSDFEGFLAGKLRFHIFHFHFWRNVSHESFVFTSSTFRFWGISRTKAAFSHLQLSLFEGSLAREAFLKVSGCTKCCVLQDKTCLGRWMGKLLRRAVAEHARLNRDHGRIRRTVELLVQASFSQLELSKFERCLARKLSFSHLPLWDFEGSLAGKLRLHIFWRDVSHESFGCTSSTFRFWGMSRSKASCEQLQLSLFEEGLAREAIFGS